MSVTQLKQPLTVRESDAFDFIVEYMGTHGWPPTIRELADGLGLSSKATAHRLIHRLHRKGWIEIAPGPFRQALKVVS